MSLVVLPINNNLNSDAKFIVHNLSFRSNIGLYLSITTNFCRVFPISLTMISIYNRSKLCIIHCMQIFRDLNQQWLIIIICNWFSFWRNTTMVTCTWVLFAIHSAFWGKVYMTIVCNRLSISRDNFPSDLNVTILKNDQEWFV